MSYFSFLGHFEKDRVFISWLSERPYASLLLGLLGCSRDTQSPWALDNLLNVDKWVEYLMAINLPPGSIPRLLVNVLERGPSKVPSNLRKPLGENRPAKAWRERPLESHL